MIEEDLLSNIFKADFYLNLNREWFEKENSQIRTIKPKNSNSKIWNAKL